jgi:hypothetical protein
LEVAVVARGCCEAEVAAFAVGSVVDVRGRLKDVPVAAISWIAFTTYASNEKRSEIVLLMNSLKLNMVAPCLRSKERCDVGSG